MKYQAIHKVGARGRQWLIVNEAGGLVKEFDGTKAQAEREAAGVEHFVASVFEKLTHTQGGEAMKMRWRRLTRTELEIGSSLRGVVEVRVNEWDVAKCVLEFQEASQTRKAHWTRVELTLIPSAEGNSDARPGK